MATTAFEAKVRRHPQLAMIDLRGEFDAAAQAALSAAYDLAERTVPEVILLNFSQVTYINSAGVSLVIELLARARKNRRRVVAHGLSPHYTKIFQITRLVDHMTIYPDEEAALAELFG